MSEVSQVYLVQAPESSNWGAKESFRGHIVSDILGKTLATAPPSGGSNFSCGDRPPAFPAGAGAKYI